ncbi:DUF2190 family protein [uncultured Sulfitobacter sp.]|uniref:DUF2190 family protein n=1 Tax=uncultured Sulfitobacter sp. TaxID=191468 RepID=UPI00260BF64A|nr:DUF2190 family protein [uncultured Sulfitobacter sp.]
MIVTTGFFDMPKVSPDDLAVGDAIDWKAADSAVISTASANPKIGVVVSAVGNPYKSVRVRLNGTF